MSIVLPLPLRSALEAGTCTLFLGAGIGHYAVDADGKPAPDAAALAREVAAHFKIEIGDQADLAKVSQVVVSRRGREDLEAFLTKRLANLEPSESLVWLLERTWSAIFTTNYDRLIQRAYERMAEPSQRYVSITNSADVVPVDPRFEVPIYHLHGSLFEGEKPFALITESDYATFREHRRMLFDVLKISYATTPILYIGYSNTDPNWSTVMAELQADFSPSRPPESWRVSPGTSALDIEVLRTQGVSTLPGDLDDLVAAYQSALGDLHVDPSRLEQLEKRIPTDLLPAFGISPAAVARLLNSWEYVNQQDFSASPNTYEFLRGDRPSWSLVAQDIPFERDIEEEVLDTLLDFATTTESKVVVSALLAPAGYGVTTVLMKLAASLVKERAGTVLFHHSGASFLEGDVEFAVRTLPGPIFFFVDNAADAGESLVNAVGALRAAGKSAYVMLGERLNEWRQRRLRIRPRQFGIDPLSEAEIQRLLERLEAHGALGVLQDLSADLRSAAIRQRYTRELLVAMREATEGQAFSAIVEDEYWNLDSDLAKSVYGMVCALYRVRAMPRDGLIAAVLDCNVMDLYGDVANSLDGVVVFEVIDEARDISAARARHHVIAEIVWERCLGSAERETLLLRTVEALNLNYGQDAKAFESLYRSDEAIDSFASLEARIDFFEIACKKDPRSPYVRQHYARMLRRSGKSELALDQVKAGLELDENVRALHHTMGMILSDMVFRSDSTEIARRRLAQAESEFLRVLQMNPKDEYGYQGLAQLYLDWAAEAKTPDESAEYLRKSETVVSDGMRKVRDRESLWIVSSKIADFIDDSPQVLASLERAIHENADASVARYLLAREYLVRKEYPKVISTVRPTLESTPDEYRAGLLFATASHRLTGEYSEATAVLRLGELTGSRDSRFVATLGGMLFMSGQLSDARDVFVRARERSFTYEARNRIEFVPGRGDERVELEGVVQQVRPGFTFLRVPGMSDFYCPIARFGAIQPVDGMKVAFQPGFTIRGAEAVAVRLPA